MEVRDEGPPNPPEYGKLETGPRRHAPVHVDVVVALPKVRG